MVLTPPPFAAFDPSLALARIFRIDQTGITTSTPQTMPPFLNIEALAQTCGLHLRWVHDFHVQAYLLSLSGLTCPDLPPVLPMTIRATLLTRTATAARYAVCIDGGPDCEILMGMRPSPDDTFFRARFQCLRTPS